MKLFRKKETMTPTESHPPQKKKIYQLYRTNGTTSYTQYVGEHLENAKATFILYPLFSNDHIRMDHKTWKLSIYEVNELFIDGWNEYFSIDSYEIIQFEKKYPQYLELLKDIPENIDKISTDLKIYDQWLSILECQEKIDDIEIMHESLSTYEELLDCFLKHIKE